MQLVFDSGATVDDRGLTLPSNIGRPKTTETTGVSLDVDGPNYTVPVNLNAPDREVRYIGWEFVLSDLSGGDTTAAVLAWWQEFWNDKAADVEYATESQQQQPEATTRLFGDLGDDSVPWAREVDAVAEADGSVGHNLLTRRLSVYSIGAPASYYVPMIVHANWVHLAFYVDDSDQSTIFAADGSMRLRIYAHVGNHQESLYLRETGAYPYRYGAFIGRDV